MAAERPPPLPDLLGVRSSKGRYYREYRHSALDLQRALQAVTSLSRVLAEAPGDAAHLVDSTLPVLARLLRASAVVLVSEHPGLGGARACVPARGRRVHAVADDPVVGDLVAHAERLRHRSDAAPQVVRMAAEAGTTLLLAPLPAGAPGFVLAAVPMPQDADATALALLGTLTNQLGGALESCRRLAESERLREAADQALTAAAAQAAVLENRNELLRRTRTDLLAARETQVLAEERQRIARDLHDSVAQHVLSMGMQVQWCRSTSDQPEVVQRLTEVTDLARLTVERIRQAIYELSGSDELQQGLLPALRRLGDQHSDHGLAIRVRARGEPVRLPQSLQQTLYTAAKEALFNVVLHAEAARAAVHLVYRRGQVRLHVTDDGRGQAAVLRRHLAAARLECADGYHRGLVNLEERVRRAGGRLSIHDVPRGGVRLQVSLPLDAAGIA